ncbi:Nn.00g049020.m01.CDS01 [Neocucurbitaria sp. VM-36]
MHRSSYSFVKFLPDAPEIPHLGHTPASALLPGYPDVAVDNSQLFLDFLLVDLECKDLDKISDYLWLMSKQSSQNISQLHQQRVKRREIIVTEEPKLHMIWFYDRIHIKPIPRYLLSRHFWESCLLDPKQPLGSTHDTVLTSALGFIRSYAHMIKYESDLRIAQERSLALMPDFVKWEQWRIIRVKLLAIRDDDVSGRFRFGEIRLTRLNFYCKFLLSRTYYYRTYRQYGDYFASFYPPLLFLFGIVSTLLGSMQLAATIEQYDSHWRGLIGMFRIASAVVIVVTILLLMTLVGIFAYKLIKEWKFALRCRYSLQEKRAIFSLKP